MTGPITSSPQPSGDDFFHIAFKPPPVDDQKVFADHLQSLLDDPQRFQEAVLWKLKEVEYLPTDSEKRLNNESICTVLTNLLDSFHERGAREPENFEHVYLTLLASCSVVRYFAYNNNFADPFPRNVYDLLSSSLDIIAIYHQEYRFDPIARRYLGEGLSFLSDALSTDRDIGRWVPNSQKRPLRSRIVEFLDRAFEQAVESDLLNNLESDWAFLELKLLNEEVKIAGFLRLHELGEHLPILMRQALEFSLGRESDDDHPPYLEFQASYDFGLENSEWAESETPPDRNSNLTFLDSEVVGSLIDSFGRIAEGAYEGKVGDTVLESKEAIHELLLSRHPTWPSWVLCLRGFMKLSRQSIPIACELLENQLLAGILEEEIKPQVLQQFIANDWEAKELLCHVVQGMSSDCIEHLARLLDHVVDSSDPSRNSMLSEQVRELYHRKTPSYYAAGFDL